MLKLIIEDDEGRKTVVPFMRDEITIGRQEGNTIRLTERNVSRRHARLLRQNGHVLVEDLGSYNGVRINGERIQGPAQVEDGDLIQIGDYDLAVQREVAQPVAPTVRVPTSALQAAIAQAESAAAAAAAAHPEQEEVEDADEEIAVEPPDESTTVLPGRQRHSTAVIRLDQVEMNRPRRVASVDVTEAPRLIIVSPEFKGQEFACIRTEMRVGRTEDNDIAIDHRSLSRLHAKIVREDTGEWRVLDMQSANGMSLNGEIYAQATLTHGDLLELGHVKLRFIGPGERVGGLIHDGKKGSRKGLAVALAGLVLVGAAGGAAWFFLMQNPAAPTPPPTTPVTVVDPAPREVTPPPSTPTPPAENAAPTPPPAAADALEPKLQLARDAIQARDFDQAVTVLDALGTPGPRPAQAEELLTQARAEQGAKKALDQAQKDLEAGRPRDAQAGLAASAGTVAFASEHTALKARVDAALKAAEKPAPAPPATLPVVAVTPPREDPAAATQKLLADGTTLFRQKQFSEAEVTLKKCIALDPNNAPCHMVLGTTEAKLNHPDEGARFYRKFLQLAPNDPKAPAVKKLVEEYEKSQPTGGGK